MCAINQKLEHLVLDESRPAVPELFFEELRIGDLQLETVGLCLNLDSGVQITASAAGRTDEREINPGVNARVSEGRDGVCTPPLFPQGTHPAVNGEASLCSMTLIRAYFELIERFSLLNQPGPTASQDQPWVYSKSNGVAAHTDRELAQTRATWELIERDSILRSWYSGTPPERLTHVDSKLKAKLSAYYSDIEAYRFAPKEGGIKTIAVFGFPLTAKNPFFCGFASDTSLENAVKRATNEGLQRLGFLWGEATPEDEPEFSKSPAFHLEYFLRSKGIQRVQRWLAGEFAGKGHLLSEKSKPEILEFVDLTPHHLKSKLTVTRAVSKTLIPLTFGRGNPRVPEDLTDEFLIHPIA